MARVSAGIRAVNASRAARLALLVLLGAAGIWLYHETRGTTLWVDEWTWAQFRRGHGLATFLRPHNQHLSLVPVAIYKLLFATAGLGDYRPYRVLVIAGHLLCVGLVFVYAERRVGSLAALVVGALLLFLGPAWGNIIWPFQIAWLISIAAGVGALLMLDRKGGRGDVAAGLLLTLSLASSGIGVAIMLGMLVEAFGFARERLWRRLLVVAVPLALYGLWFLVYQEHSLFVRHNIVAAPRFVADAAAATIAALTGLIGSAPLGAPPGLGWGPPLALAALVLVGWRIARLRPVPVRLLTLLAMPLAFWLLTALNRAQISQPYASRYLYVGGVFLILVGVEAARGLALPRAAALTLGIAAAAAVISNIGAFRDGARFLREQAQMVRADLDALEIGHPPPKPDYVAKSFPEYPFEVVHANEYFALARRFGTPADPQRLAGEPEPAREEADAELARIHSLSLRPAPRRVRLGVSPVIDHVTGGMAARRGPCVLFRASGSVPPQQDRSLELRIPGPGVLLTARGAQADVGVRRFASGFQPLGSLAPSGRSALRVGTDRSPLPWHIRLSSSGLATACGLS